MPRNLENEMKAVKRQIEEAGYEILLPDSTEILFNPAYRGTPEREQLVADLLALLEESED